MEDFPGNSQKARVPNEPKKIERVTSAEAGRRKRGLGRKFKETFIGGDAKTAFEYMAIEVVVPAIRDTVFDAIQGGIQELIYGENGRRKRSSSTPGGYGDLGHFDYRGVRTPSRASKPASSPRMMSRKSRARGTFDELIIPSRQEAEDVIDRMFDILSRYGGVSVADLYELTGVQSQHTDMRWGWIELRGAKVVRLRQGGYLLDLPDPEPFD